MAFELRDVKRLSGASLTSLWSRQPSTGALTRGVCRCIQIMDFGLKKYDRGQAEFRLDDPMLPIMVTRTWATLQTLSRLDFLFVCLLFVFAFFLSGTSILRNDRRVL